MLQIVTLLMIPVGGLLVGLAAYRIATRSDQERHHPAE